jgi:RPA family protein
LGVELIVDDEKIVLNEFVEKILTGIIVGALVSLKGIKEDFERVRIEITDGKLLRRDLG